MPKRLTFLLVATILVVSCIRNSSPNVRLRFDYKPRTIASSALTCIAVNIVGEGIASQAADSPDKNLPAALAGDHCSYPGVTTKLVPRNQAGTFELTVPPGKNRLIQVFGVESSDGCADVSLGEILAKAKVANALPATYGGIYEAGRAVVDLVKTTTVNVTNTFDGDNPKDYKTCAGANGTNNLSFGTTANTIHIGGKIGLSVSGGSGGNTFQVISGGGSIAAGIYTAPATNGTATIRVTDSQGHQKEHNISVFDANAIATVQGWHIAASLDNHDDGYALTSGDGLPDLGTANATPDLNYLQTTMNYSKTDGPNGTPTLKFSGGALKTTTVDLPSTSTMSFYLVAKSATSSGGFFCMTGGIDCTGGPSDQYARAQTGGGTYIASLNSGLGENWLSNSLLDPGEFAIQEIRWISSSVVEYNVGGDNDNQTANLPTSFYYNGNGRFFWGLVTSGTGITGSISESLIFRSSLSTSERNSVLSYLAGKYKLTKPN